MPIIKELEMVRFETIPVNASFYDACPGEYPRCYRFLKNSDTSAIVESEDYPERKKGTELHFEPDAEVIITTVSPVGIITTASAHKSVNWRHPAPQGASDLNKFDIARRELINNAEALAYMLERGREASILIKLEWMKRQISVLTFAMPGAIAESERREIARTVTHTKLEGLADPMAHNGLGCQADVTDSDYSGHCSICGKVYTVKTH